MDYLTHRFCDPNSLIDRVHTLFERFENEKTLAQSLDEDTLQRLKLAVHEWLANLVQHGNFDDRVPEITLTMQPVEQRVRCIIEDNSEGFDLDGHLSARNEVLDAFPERGMGLLMIKSCTEDLSYQELRDGYHRLEFIVAANQDPWLNIPF